MLIIKQTSKKGLYQHHYRVLKIFFEGLKEGCSYRLQVTFRTQHEIVTGLKFVNTVIGRPSPSLFFIAVDSAVCEYNVAHIFFAGVQNGHQGVQRHHHARLLRPQPQSHHCGRTAQRVAGVPQRHAGSWQLRWAGRVS